MAAAFSAGGSRPGEGAPCAYLRRYDRLVRRADRRPRGRRQLISTRYLNRYAVITSFIETGVKPPVKRMALVGLRRVRGAALSLYDSTPGCGPVPMINSADEPRFITHIVHTR